MSTIDSTMRFQNYSQGPEHSKIPPDLEESTQPRPQSPDIRDFRKIWERSIEDNNLALYGFRRFKTSHLVNLRFLEGEIAQLDHEIYQAGLKSMSGVDLKSRGRDRLGLRFSKKDADLDETENLITPMMVRRLRNLLKDYDEALASFNKIMTMETCSLIDDERESRKRTELHPYEIYHTRLVRVDLGLRSTQDPFHRGIHKALRAFRYWKLNKLKTDEEEVDTTIKNMSYQNSVLIADVLARFLVALVAGAFMVLPLVMISYQDTQKSHLITISVWILVFAVLISTTLKTGGLTTLGTAAAYAAVLAGFVSNS